MSNFLAITVLLSGTENGQGRPDEAFAKDHGFIFSARQLLCPVRFHALPEMSRPPIHGKHDLNFKGGGGKKKRMSTDTTIF